MTAQVAIAARRNPLVAVVARAMREARVPGDAVVTVAVSGGRDSLALLTALTTMRDRGELGGLVVAHVHHHRRTEADEEARHVQAVAERFDVPCAIHHLPEDDRATPSDLRTRRYDALVAIARAWDSGVIATGHHAGDQVETVLLAMVRGAGPRGLSGMSAARMLNGDIMLVRPMLLASRVDTASMCGDAELAWCDDPTNEDPATRRGSLRRDVLPHLESIGPGLDLRVAAGCEVQHAAAEALADAALDPTGCSWTRADLAAVSSGLRLTSLHRAVQATGVSADTCASAALRDAAAAVIDDKTHLRRFEIGGGAVIEVDAQTVRIAQD